MALVINEQERFLMSIVKLSKKLNLLFLRKRPFFFKRSKLSAYVSTILFATLIGTYLELYFVGKEFYDFPKRPFPEVFSINISFTIIGLPLFVFLFLYLAEKVTPFIRVLLIITISLFAPAIEMQAELLVFFHHNESWNHFYSFFGYFLFLIIVWRFYQWSRV